jgi:nucleotide-binding universal stress UspA family protein
VELAGIIAGSGGKPTTIIDLTDKTKNRGEETDERAATGKSRAKPDGEHLEQAVKTAAESTASLDYEADDKSATVDVITRHYAALNADVVAGEARKGYDLLIVGIAITRDPTGGFSKDLSMLTQRFKGPLVVVDALDGRRALAGRRHGRILIPVSGTEASRRGLEVGLTLARATDAHVTALYVTRANSAIRRRSASRRQVVRRDELAVLKDVAALAERYEVPLRNATRTDMAPEAAIRREAERGYDLIVLGVSRRPGDLLFFGNTAAAVLEKSPTSNLFVAS